MFIISKRQNKNKNRSLKKQNKKQNKKQKNKSLKHSNLITCKSQEFAFLIKAN